MLVMLSCNNYNVSATVFKNRYMTITESKGVMELPFCNIRVNICIGAGVLIMYLGKTELVGQN